MPPKRKTVRFVEDEVKHSESALLKRSAKRRPGDQTINTESDGYDIGPGPSAGDRTVSVKKYKSKHTLDSDEEEEDQDVKLNVETVEGQEDATIDFDDNTKITPFNMTEELEEGYYDAEGNFVHKKEKEIKDAWLDNIDWAQIKREAGHYWNRDEDETDDQLLHVDQLEIYNGILGFMQPGETITKSLKRLSGNRNIASLRQQRWKARKDKQKLNEQISEIDSDSSKIKIQPDSNASAEPQRKESVEESESFVDNNAERVIKLTEFVDKLVSEGEFEIYGFTYEKIKYEIEKRENMQKFREKLDTKAEIATDDKDLDMFADEIDKKSLETVTDIQPKNVAEEKSATSTNKDNIASSTDNVQWEFKWINEDQAPIYGPCSSDQMQQWVDVGYFKDGVFVRRTDQSEGQFYSSKRIDFELYM